MYHLITNKDCKNISAINLESKQVEIEVEKIVGNYIIDFRLFGEQEEKAIAVTEDGHILLYNLDYNQKTGSVINSFKIELKEERKEEAQSIAVCDKNEYAIVEIGQSESPWVSSRMVIIKIEGDSLIKKAMIDQHSQKIGYKLALESLGYIGRHILWVGLSKLENGVAQLYVYDIERGEFKELQDKRVIHKERSPAKIHRMGSELYYTGSYGKIMRLRLKYNIDLKK